MELRAVHLSTHLTHSPREASLALLSPRVSSRPEPLTQMLFHGLQNPFPVLCCLTKASILKNVRLQVGKNRTQLYQHDFREKRAWGVSQTGELEKPAGR